VYPNKFEKLQEAQLIENAVNSEILVPLQ